MNNKNIIGASIFALSCFGFFVFILPGYDSIKAAREILGQRERRLQERTELVAKVAALNQQYQQNTDNLITLDSLLPTDKQPDQIVSSIYDIASQAGLNLTEMAISEPSNNQSETVYQANLVGLQLIGQYGQLFNFLQLLEQSLRLYDLQNFTITESIIGGSQSRALNFQLKINANSID